MFEDKLIEKIRYDKQSVEEMFRLLSSMVNVNERMLPSDKSTAAILTVMKTLGIQDSNLTEDDHSRTNYKNIFHSMGIISRPVKCEGKWWKDATGPFLAIDRNDDFVPLIPSFLGYYRIDTSTGEKVKLNNHSTKDLDTNMICFCKELQARKLTIKDLYKYVLKTINIRNIIYIVVICVIVVLLGMLIPFANKMIFNDIIPSGDSKRIIPICSFLFGVGLSAALLQVNRNMILTRVKDKLNANLQTAVMARVFSLPNRFFKEYSPGDLSARALSINTLYQLITNELLATVAVGLFSTMYIFIAFVYAKSLVWLVTLIVAIFVILYILIYRDYSKRNCEVLPYKTATQGLIYSIVSGIHKIRNNGAEARAMEQWATRFSKSELLSDDAPFMVKYQKAITLFIISASTIAVFYFSWKADISISNFIAFNSAFGVMLAAFDELHMVMVEISQLVPQVKLITPIIEAVPENADKSERVDGISGGLELNNVTFRYSPVTPPVLKNITLRIRPGENVGMVGLSGCGKSSLMRLMMGFEIPTSGSIFYDHYNLNNINLNSLHQFTGYCPQETHIFPDTVINNIKITNPEATEEEVWEAARIACIADDIKRMPNQMNTILGEGGSGMSGGQCQRIMIARAVLNRPSIIFFDEATSALDNLTQKKVVKNLNDLKCTRISIAHRLSTIEHCDRILVLDKGSIVEDGTPAELMAKQNFFYKLAQRQQL